jgi:hypothetical protein
MTKHVLSVHEEKKPFKCEICYYSCSENGSLNKHFIPFHEEKKYDIKYLTHSIIILDPLVVYSN